MNVELVPCPDCSSSAEVLEDYYIGTSQSFSCVHCTNPSCQLFAHNPHFTGSSAE